MPAPIVIRNLSPETKIAANPEPGEPLIATKADLRDGSRGGGAGGGSYNPDQSTWADPTIDLSTSVSPDGSLILDADFTVAPEWAAQHTDQRYLYDGYTGTDGSLGYVAGDNVPPYFDYYYYSEFWHPNGDKNGNGAVPGSQPVAQISTLHGNKADPNGKSWIMYDESIGGKGQWGTDSIMTRDIGLQREELYMEVDVRFSPDWVWHTDTGLYVTGDADTTGDGEANSDGGMKFMRVVRFSGETTRNRFSFFGADNSSSMPWAVFDFKAWNFTGDKNLARVLCAIRGYNDPANYGTDDSWASFQDTYPTKVEESIRDSQGNSYDWLDLIGKWLKFSWRIGMDSAPGAGDGYIQVWMDDGVENVLQIDVNDIPWRRVGDPDVMGWNSVSLGGNLNNSPYDSADQFEQWYQVDNFKIYNGKPA